MSNVWYKQAGSDQTTNVKTVSDNAKEREETKHRSEETNTRVSSNMVRI